MGRAAAPVALVVLVAAPFLLIGLGAVPFDDPGEGMHAEIARELGQSRDPFALTLNGVRYLDKPPLLYGLLVGAFAVGGATEAAARAVPALAALVAVAATAWLGARLLGRAGGILSGLALLTSTGFFVYGRYLRPETLFVAMLAAGFALSLVGLVEERRPLVAAGLLAFGLAALAKDPLGVLAPPAAIGLALVLGRRAQPLSRWLPWGAAAAALLIGFGWWLGAEARTPGFTWYTVIDNHVLNVARARHFPDEDVPLSAPQFLVVGVVGAAPWALAAAAALWSLLRRRAWRDHAELPWVVLAIWALGVLGVTAVSGFRLPHYGLPAYPAIALLAARGWRDAGRLVIAHALLFAVLATACALAWWSGEARFTGGVMSAVDVATRKSAAAGNGTGLPAWDSLETLLGATTVVFAVGALALGALTLGAPLGRRDRAAPRRLAGWLVAATMLAVMPAVGSARALVSAQRAVRDLAVEVARRAGAADLVAHEGPLENSGAFEWYAQRRPVIVEGRRSVLGFGATRSDTGDVFWDAARLRRAWESGQRVWVVTTRTPERSLVGSWPGATLVTAAGGRALYVNRDSQVATRSGVGSR